MTTRGLALLLALGLVGCPAGGGLDEDGDGYATPADCDDGDPAVHPDAAEQCDGFDNDCDGQVDEEGDAETWYIDGDGDGFGGGEGQTTCLAPLNGVQQAGDCDDADPAVRPDAEEVICDGLDNDCDAGTVDSVDSDGDGADSCVDCDDADPTRWPDQAEVACNGVDDDCDAGTPDDTDADLDGVSSCAGDCDDAEPLRHPGAEEVSCDGLDNDCDDATADAPDGDGDGVTLCDGDCDDNDAARSPLAAELSCNGVDDDCDASTVDAPDDDGDGATACEDCDDADAGRSPTASEVHCNGVDDDCAPVTVDAPDGDGDGVSLCDGDCDDGDAARLPGAAEVVCSSVDEDCDAATADEPADGDGDGVALCDGDCDDADSGRWPGNAEQGCDGVDNDCDDSTPDRVDADADGYAACEGDCDDAEALRSPGLAEVACNGLDDDCDPATEDGVDGDGDGVSGCGGDCDDADPDRFPGNTEAVCDSVDNDCDPATLDGPDGDGDGVDACSDCDDADGARVPGGLERWCDGVDNDCDPATADGVDADGDGADHCVDCDDGDPARSPAFEEQACTLVDEDCDPTTEDGEDADGDGVAACAGDCADGDAARSPLVPEAVCNGYDDDCDPSTSDGVDYDGDGLAGCAGDCDDGDPERSPRFVEVPCNGVDEDCDPATIDDADSDGDGFSTCDGDCDDADAGVAPGGVEVPCNGVDDDCDASTSDGDDLDGDGVSGCGGDCDDADPLRFPGAIEQPCSGVDEDCDPGTLDEEDLDGDGQSQCAGDCDDSDAARSSSAVEVPCNGLDDDCDPGTPDGDDQDGDGVAACAGDCDDGDPAVLPGIDERHCNGLDDDCDPTTGDDVDVDADGWSLCDQDCDDEDAERTPGSEEQACNGLDDDCDPATEDGPDEDGDGTSSCAGDCADNDPSRSPAWQEQPCNGVDDDCDAATVDSPDGDGDGWSLCDGDCDDSDPARHPTAYEELCNGVDDDCDSATPDSPDLDGDGVAGCAGDCDDRDASRSPSLTEVSCNGVDDDCDELTVDEPDLDGDGVSSCGLDCDDSDPQVHGLYPELLCNGVDDDCDPSTRDDPDADGDGYSACAGDCRDEEASVHPGAVDDCATPWDDDCDPLTIDDCSEFHCGTIDRDTVWAAGTEHIVGCVMNVRGSTAPTLTIEDGARVSFMPGAGLRVGDNNWGSLVVQGDTVGVVFAPGAGIQPPMDVSMPALGGKALPPVSETGLWEGLYFGNYATATSVRGARIEGGGMADGAAVYVVGSAPYFVDCTITGSAAHGVLVEGSGAPTFSGTTIAHNLGDGLHLSQSAQLGSATTPSFVGNAIYGNAGYPAVLNAVAAGQLDGSSSFLGNGVDVVRVLEDTVDSDVRWRDLDAPYQVAGPVYVRNSDGPSLTIEDGVRALFEPAAGLHVGVSNWGDLVVEGGTRGVVFESAQAVPQPGDWDGVVISTYSSATTLDGLTVRHAGEDGVGALRVSSSAPTLSGCRVEQSAGHGLEVDNGAAPAVSDCRFDDNAGDGVHVASSGALATTGGPTFTGNAMRRNLGYAMSLPAGYVDQIAASGQIEDNATQAIQVVADTVERSGSWTDPGVPYQVAGEVLVRANGNPVLTIEDGVTMRFDAGTALRVGVSDWGSLVVAGGSRGVLATSSSTTPLPGDWLGIELSTYSAGSVLQGLSVEYGGGNGQGGLLLSSASPTIVGGSYRLSSQHGIAATNGSFPAVSGALLSANAGDGLFANSSSGLSRTGGPTFHDNTSTGNAGHALTVPADYAAQLDASSSVAGNGVDRVRITADDVTVDGTWQALDAPYRVAGVVRVRANNGPRLTIADGVEADFDPGAAITVGESNWGSLAVEGGGLGVRFSSSQDTPAPGDWDGLLLDNYSAGSSLIGLALEHGGGGTYAGNLVLQNSSPTIGGGGVWGSASHGIYVSGDSRPVISGVTVANCLQDGVHVTPSAGLSTTGTPTFDRNTITGNGGAPLVLPANSITQVGSGGALAGNFLDRVIVTGDDVTDSGSWRPLDVPWRVVEDVYVRANDGPVLTVEDGVAAEFDTDVDLYAGLSNWGSLVVDAPAQGALFTSAQGTPAPGDWSGVTLHTYAGGSSLTGLVVEYAGGDGAGGIAVHQTSAPLVGCAVRYSAAAGLNVGPGGSVAVAGSVFEANAAEGVYVDPNGGLTRGELPTFTGNVLTANGTWPVRLPGDFVGQLDASSAFTGNGDDRVAVTADDVTADATWQALDVPLLLVEDVSVRASSGPVLQLAGGAELQLEVDVGLVIGDSNWGSLVVDGASDEVLMSSAQGSPAPGDWRALELSTYAGGSEITGLRTEYGGGGGALGSVRLVNVEVPVEASAFTLSATNGLHLGGGGVATVVDSSFDDNDLDGLYVEDAGALAHGDQPGLRGSSAAGNGGAPLNLPMSSSGEVAADCALSGNGDDAVVVRGGSLAHDGRWEALDVPYRAEGGVVYVRGNDTPQLVVSDGAVVQFSAGSGLRVGEGNWGGLTVEGAGLGVTFGPAQPGETWEGVTLSNYASTVAISGLTVDSGGDNGWGNLAFWSVGGTVSASVMSNSSTWGIYRGNGAAPVLTDVQYVGNASGELY